MFSDLMNDYLDYLDGMRCKMKHNRLAIEIISYRCVMLLWFKVASLFMFGGTY